MSFYSDLAKVYDIVFPVKNVAVNFIAKNMDSKNSTVLDVACGIGGHCRELATTCHSINGIDFEQEMIDFANKKNLLPNTHYQTGDMLSIDRIFQKIFSHIYCIGNSIVHLSSKKAILTFLEKSFKQLNSSGELVIQIINYDRIFNEEITSLPLIESKDVLFKRMYKYSGEQEFVDFVTELTIGENIYNNSIKLYALKSKDLQSMLQNVGFKSIEFFGDFKESPYTNSSYATVVRAKKL
jgi:2-polyprenyl-3-methyl-5-hydroxy-6-metoxy-1,4-benzoquinol methylase